MINYKVFNTSISSNPDLFSLFMHLLNLSRDSAEWVQTSVRHLSQITGLSTTKVRTNLKRLKETDTIKLQTCTKLTHVSINNIRSYTEIEKNVKETDTQIDKQNDDFGNPEEVRQTLTDEKSTTCRKLENKFGNVDLPDYIHSILPHNTNVLFRCNYIKERKSIIKIIPKMKERFLTCGDDEFYFAAWFVEQLDGRYTTTPHQFLKSMDVYLSLIRRGKTKDEIYALCEWALSDEFWKLNFRSANKLIRRDKDNVLYYQIFENAMLNDKNRHKSLIGGENKETIHSIIDEVFGVATGKEGGKNG